MIDLTHEIYFWWFFWEILELHFEFKFRIFEDTVPHEYYAMPNYCYMNRLPSRAFICGITYIPKFAEYNKSSLLHNGIILTIKT